MEGLHKHANTSPDDCTLHVSLLSFVHMTMVNSSNRLPNAPQLRQPMPLYLISRVHSLLMSTLLQPSAMLLALWYIVQLPVYFGAPGLGPEHVKERRFRVELLNDARNVVEGESLEGAATFRLIVLGCMLANKWLDDHTFSNKTW